MTHLQKQDCRDSGFTLVELAIVMIIIGLLIGGILKGQELIANAQVAATVAQLKGVDAATSTFKDSYNALPGDMGNVQVAARVPNCAAAPCNNGGGNGNGRIETAAERQRFWIHLNAADLVSGVDGTLTAAWGQNFPAAPSGGGHLVLFSANGALAGINGGNARGGHYLTIQGNPAGAAGVAANTALTASEAARIDRKMDDGLPVSGAVRGAGGGNCSAAAAGSPYLESTDQQACDLYVRIQS